MSFVQGVSGVTENRDSGVQGELGRIGVEDQVGSSVHLGGLLEKGLRGGVYREDFLEF